MEKNELMIIENIEKRLKAKREPIIFPLSPTHRKELRNLKSVNIGNLKEQLRNIRKIKQDLYTKKYTLEIQKMLKEKLKICVKLNKDWGERIIKIEKLINERKILEGKDLNLFTINRGYTDVSSLKVSIGDMKREFIIDEERVIKDITQKSFEDKYGSCFKKVMDQIEDLNTKYEESINFGDLEIVKELYYIMKTSGSLFEKLDKMDM